jgi:hypothetical protein
MKNCSNCGVELLPTGTNCHICESDIGFPNVRKAESEKEQLFERYASVENSIQQRDISDVTKNFQGYIQENAKLVLAKSVVDVIGISNPNKMFATFHQEVRMNARIAQDNQFDKNRDGFESIVNPQYYEKIHYAALSLTNKGITYYGAVQLSLDLNKVKHRTTLFEENSHSFITRHKLTGADSAPKGYRATWDDKAILATIKCSHKLSKNTTESSYSSIIVNDTSEDPDFIEAHIYGNISGFAIQSMGIIDDCSEDEKLMFKVNEKAFIKLGITIQVES